MNSRAINKKIKSFSCFMLYCTEESFMHLQNDMSPYLALMKLDHVFKYCYCMLLHILHHGLKTLSPNR